jgi:hypothetical protein
VELHLTWAKILFLWQVRQSSGGDLDEGKDALVESHLTLAKILIPEVG